MTLRDSLGFVNGQATRVAVKQRSDLLFKREVGPAGSSRRSLGLSPMTSSPSSATPSSDIRVWALRGQRSGRDHAGTQTEQHRHKRRGPARAC